MYKNRGALAAATNYTNPLALRNNGEDGCFKNVFWGAFVLLQVIMLYWLWCLTQIVLYGL